MQSSLVSNIHVQTSQHLNFKIPNLGGGWGPPSHGRELFQNNKNNNKIAGVDFTKAYDASLNLRKRLNPSRETRRRFTMGFSFDFTKLLRWVHVAKSIVHPSQTYVHPKGRRRSTKGTTMHNFSLSMSQNPFHKGGKCIVIFPFLIFSDPLDDKGRNQMQNITIQIVM